MGLRGAQHLVHHLEFLLPQAHLGLDALPLGFLHFAETVALDHHGLVHLVEPRVDHLVRDSLNSPLFDLAHRQVQQLGQPLVAEVRLVRRQTANSHVALLLDGLLARDALSLHQLVELAQL